MSLGEAQSACVILAYVGSVSVRVSEKRMRNESQRPCISRAAKTENPVPRSFCATKLNENAFLSKYNSNGQNNQFCRRMSWSRVTKKRLFAFKRVLKGMDFVLNRIRLCGHR